MSDLDLDALERKAEFGTPILSQPVLRALIQRLRAAEAEIVTWKNKHREAWSQVVSEAKERDEYLSELRAAEVRIAQLEAELALATSIDPRTYGAVSNGVTDDTPAFQAAVDIAHLGSENMKLRARIEALERVREAGELYRIAVDHAQANEKPDSWAAWQHLDHLRDEFFATLAAMEEPAKA